jgi:glutamine synthetase adenylyltransferase
VREEFETFIQQTVDPVRTGQRLDQLLADPAVYATLALVNPEQRHNLVTLLSAANFLCHQISQQPDILSGIGEISCPSDIDTESLQTFDELRLYKYRELLKICWMDISGHDYEDVLQALSTLAEVIVRTALRLCLDSSDYELVMRYMTIIAMGKLGAQELNLSSDVDLIIVSTNQDEYADDFQGLQHKLFNCVRLLSKNLEQKTEKGFLYRVDLKLRPWGESGALVVSNDYMLDYFASNARPWERFAWLRARPIAGNYDLANQLIKEINPMLFRKSLGADDLTRFIEIKNDMQRVRNRKGHWNVKLGNGGIRDIEFFVQMLQIVNGAREPDLQITNTLAVIKSLVRHGLILEHEADSITASYLFLRRLENRLQMVDELQTHNLPDAITSRKQLVYTLVPFDQQDDDLTLFEVLLKKHQDIAKKYFDRIIPVQNKRVYDEQMESFVSRTWYEDMAKASTQRWLELCNNESLGNIPEHIEKLIAIFGSSWYFTRHIFFRGYESAELIDSAHSLRYDYVSISEHLRVGSSSEEPEHRVEQLRQVKNDLMLQILTRFLEGYSDQLQTEIALSNLARGVFNSMFWLVMK